MVLWVLILVRLLPMTPAWNLRVSSRRRLASSVGSARPVCPFISPNVYLGVQKEILTVTPLVLNQDTSPRPLAFLEPRDEEIKYVTVICVSHCVCLHNTVY